jgi:hypothetical protein
VRSIGEGKESRFVFGMGDGEEETDTRGARLLAFLMGDSVQQIGRVKEWAGPRGWNV